jgi:hypothetical protein
MKDLLRTLKLPYTIFKQLSITLFAIIIFLDSHCMTWSRNLCQHPLLENNYRYWQHRCTYPLFRPRPPISIPRGSHHITIVALCSRSAFIGITVIGNQHSSTASSSNTFVCTVRDFLPILFPSKMCYSWTQTMLKKFWFFWNFLKFKAFWEYCERSRWGNFRKIEQWKWIVNY